MCRAEDVRAMTDPINFSQWRGKDVVVAGGRQKLGKVDDVYCDTASDEPLFLCVKTGWVGRRHVLVPVQDCVVAPEHVTVPWETADVADAPTTRPGQELAVSDEERVFRHYGMDYQPTPSGRRLFRS